MKRCFYSHALRALLAISSLAIAAPSFAVDNYSASKFGSKYPTYPKLNLPSELGTSPKIAQIKRGEYLVKLGDCIACHTKRGGKPFAGGFPIKTPFGTIYTPNITPDKKTGIGSWTNKQFIRTMHEGISPTGHYYYPAFPYLYFNHVTTKDLLAIRAYLNAIPAVYQVNRKDTLMWPFSWRFLQFGWRLLFFDFQKTGPYKANPHRSKEWNRGAYIVNGLGHCSMCHTRSYYLFSRKWVLAAPIKKYKLAGNFVEGYYAPNITSKTLKNTPWEAVANVFLKNKLLGGGQVEGAMRDANHDSLQYLTTNDIKAIVAYLKTVRSETPPRPTVGKGLAAGKKIFNQYCEGCHLTGAGGAPKIGDEAAWAPRIKLGLHTLYKNAIHGIGGMPPKGTCTQCSNQEIQDAVLYMVDKSKPGGSGLATQGKAKPIKKLTMADGKKIYDRYCAACHDGSYTGAPKTGNKEEWKPLIEQGMQILIQRSITGFRNMPARGSCYECNDAQIIAAVKYMVHESKLEGDYQLW